MVSDDIKWPFFKVIPTTTNLSELLRYCVKTAEPIVSIPSRPGVLLMQTRRQKVCREMQIEMPSTSQADILQRLIRRYLFRLERMKEEGNVNNQPVAFYIH